MAEKLRVHTLANDLNVASKEIIAKCKAEGITALKNHMSVVSLGLSESIREWFSDGTDVTSVEVAAVVDLTKVRKPRRKKKVVESATDEGDGSVATVVAEAEVGQGESPAAAEVDGGEGGGGDSPAVTLDPAAVTATPEASSEVEAPVAPSVVEPVPAGESVSPPDLAPAASSAAAEGEVQETAEAAPAAPAPVEPPAAAEPVLPAGPQLIPKPASLSGPRVVRVEAPEPVRAPRPRPRPPSISAGPPGAPPAFVSATPARRGKRRGPSADEGIAAKSKSPRRRDADSERVSGERLREFRDQDWQERRERLASATGQGMRARRVAERHRRQTGGKRLPVAQKTEVTITAPIALKDYCAAISVPYSRMLPKLTEHMGSMPMINEMIGAETAELVGLEFGITVHCVLKKSGLEELAE
ncbi:MAG: translation initiation factor IF-2 N-terminal domain-containing protein, partial [Planctomycetes bacterium]|nr:translation initiation factor IF-2 N-terminal domain-containing protein [Planctomycetota bacterium]